MTGNEKGQKKKKPHNLFGVGYKRKITVNGTAYPT